MLDIVPLKLLLSNVQGGFDRVWGLTCSKMQGLSHKVFIPTVSPGCNINCSRNIQGGDSIGECKCQRPKGFMETPS
jgi:hypothetical protein